MAIGAGGLSLQDRVARWQSQFSFLASVATHTAVQLTTAYQHGIPLCMAVVAIGAGDFFLLVNTAQPEHLVFLVTIQADPIGLIGGQRPAWSKTAGWRIATGVGGMLFTGAVAADTGGNSTAA
jgi:hypothetical protein